MGVDHRRPNVAMAQEFLNRSNVVSVGQQVCREREPDCMTRDAFHKARLAHRSRQRTREQRFVDVVSALLAGFGVAPTAFLRKHELPTPLAVRVRILAGQGVRKLPPTVPIGQVLPLIGLNAPEMLMLNREALELFRAR